MGQVPTKDIAFDVNYTLIEQLVWISPSSYVGQHSDEDDSCEETIDTPPHIYTIEL